MEDEGGEGSEGDERGLGEEVEDVWIDGQGGSEGRGVDLGRRDVRLVR